MNQIKDIKNKIEWEKFYDPDFDWDNKKFYLNNKLSENFIREFQDKVNWWYISIHQTLSEEFKEEFKNIIDWDYISKFKQLFG